MISTLKGTVVSVGPARAVIDAGGFGLAVELTKRHSSSLTPGTDVFVHTSMIVRPESMTLYGFETDDELALFGILTAVTGIGPRSALAILGSLSPEQIADAVENDDDSPFRKVSGVGPKSARMIIMSLRGKVGHFGSDDPPKPAPAAAPDARVLEEVMSALLSLGWKERRAKAAVDEVVQTDSTAAQTMNTSTLLRAVLALLGPA